MFIDCNHDWWELDFIQDGSGLACSDCDRVWELVVQDQVNIEVLPDAIQTIWQSAKQAIAESKVRYQELEQVLRSRLGLDICDVCEKWLPQEEIIVLAGHKICPDDGGNMIDHLHDEVKAEFYEEITEDDAREYCDMPVFGLAYPDVATCIRENIMLARKIVVECRPATIRIAEDVYRSKARGKPWASAVVRNRIIQGDELFELACAKS